MTLLACSSNSGEESTLEKITPSDTIFSYDSLKAVDFKRSKTYKAEGLTKADSAYNGFLKEQPRIDYEVRFYDSYKDAVDYGTVFAEERTGEDAVLKKAYATWKPGVKEARSCAGNPHGSNIGARGGQLVAHDIQNCINPKYGDYIIYGNMIMLCQGWDASESMTNCETVINKLLSPSE